MIVDPREFYQELLDKAGGASKRISMSSLYLGTGKLEEQLVMNASPCLCLSISTVGSVVVSAVNVFLNFHCLDGKKVFYLSTP